MSEGWSVSGIITAQSGQPWFPSDATTDDLLGNGEVNNSGALQTWNFAGTQIRLHLRFFGLSLLWPLGRLHSVR